MHSVAFKPLLHHRVQLPSEVGGRADGRPASHREQVGGHLLHLGLRSFDVGLLHALLSQHALVVCGLGVLRFAHVNGCAVRVVDVDVEWLRDLLLDLQSLH